MQFGRIVEEQLITVWAIDHALRRLRRVPLDKSEGARVPLDKSEGSVKDKDFLGGAMSTAFLPERVEDQDSENLTPNHSAAERRSTNHRFDLVRRP